MVDLAPSSSAYRFLLLLCFSFPVLGASNEPDGINFNNDGIGPDGPWNCLNVSTDFPQQTIPVYPTLLETSMIVNATTCQDQTAQCPLPTLSMWTGSGAHDLVNDEDSTEWDPSQLKSLNGGYVTDLMGLQGSLRYISQRFTHATSDGEKYLDGTATAVADNVTVSYPNGNFYTLGIGYMSLYGGDSFTYDLPNGTDWTLKLQLYNGYNLGAYPSLSYGLHMGSALHKISGKLFLGGYDRARCIDDPIAVEKNSTFSLADISIGVAAGGSAFLNNTLSANEIDGLLQTNTSTTLPLPTQPDPGLPYLYLPGKTCAAIAAYLPVTYDAGLGLYLWNTSADEYKDIIGSPHYLSFHFHTSGSSGATRSIEIPFALLNLTLDWPIVSTDTQYFPCRPYDPPDSSQPSVVLGRAFLQGAHLAQNWGTGYVWLAQAPGPTYAEEDRRTIDSDSTSLAKLPTASLWNATWEDVLTPLSESTSGSSTDSGSTGAGSDSSATATGQGLSTGTKAGIGVGAALGGIALIGLVAGTLIWRRRRRDSVQQLPNTTQIPNETWAPQMVPQELAAPERQELPVHGRNFEELQARAKRVELPGRYT